MNKANKTKWIVVIAAAMIAIMAVGCSVASDDESTMETDILLLLQSEQDDSRAEASAGNRVEAAPDGIHECSIYCEGGYISNCSNGALLPGYYWYTVDVCIQYVDGVGISLPSLCVAATSSGHSKQIAEAKYRQICPPPGGSLP